jgi:hypothetical protein
VSAALACTWCDSSPCLCAALGIGLTTYKATKLHLRGRVVGVGNVQATYSAGLRTGEVALPVAPVAVVELQPARRRKR